MIIFFLIFLRGSNFSSCLLLSVRQFGFGLGSGVCVQWSYPYTIIIFPQGCGSGWSRLHRSSWLWQQSHPDIPPWRKFLEGLRILGLWWWRVQRSWRYRCHVRRQYYRLWSGEPQSTSILRWVKTVVFFLYFCIIIHFCYIARYVYEIHIFTISNKDYVYVLSSRKSTNSYYPSYS